MKSELVQIIIIEFNKWIELLNDPASYQKNWLNEFKQKREEIINKHYLIKHLLVNANIWGGMGSFLDSAMLDIFYFKPTSNNIKERAIQWEEAHKKCDEWMRKFNLATINLGTALIQMYEVHDQLNILEKNMIERWIDFARKYNDSLYQPLNKNNIENLEWNLNKCTY